MGKVIKKDNLISKKKIIKKQPSNKDRKITPNEENHVNILEKSLDLVSELNKKVETVKAVKEKLTNDVRDLSKKIKVHESKKYDKNNFLIEIKDEILNEFLPILNKFNLKSTKKEILKEFNSLLELEIEKIKSEFENKNKKTNKDFKKYFSNMEVKLFEAIQSNSNLKKDLKKFQNKKITELFETFEEEVYKLIDKKNKVYSLKLKKELGNNILLNKKLEEQEEISKKLSRNFSNLKSNLKNKIEVLNSKIEKDNSTIVDKFNQALEEVSNKELNYSNKLNDEFNIIIKKLDQKTKIFIDDIKKKFSKEKNITNQIFDQEILDFNEKKKSQFKDFENKFINLKNKVESEFKDNIKKFNDMSKISQSDFKKMKKDLLINIQDYIGELNKELLILKTKQKDLIKHFNKKSEEIDKKELQNKESIEIFKKDLLNKIKEYIKNLDVELNLLKNDQKIFANEKKEFIKELNDSVYKEINKLDSNLVSFSEEITKQKEIEREFVVEKINEIIDKFNKLSDENNIEIKNFKTELENLLDKKNKEIKTNILNDFAKIRLENNDFKVRLATEVKENQKDLSEKIEEKFFLTKKQFEEGYAEHISAFEERFKNSKIEFDKIKNNVIKTTEENFNKISESLNNLKVEDTKFNQNKDLFIADFENLVKAKELELNDYSNSLAKNIKGIIDLEKSTFEKNENSFRLTFNEKIAQLEEINKQNLNFFKEKLIEENSLLFKEKFDSNLKEINLISEEIKSKELTVIKKIESLESTEKDLYENLIEKEKLSQEKIETRLMTLEKQFNKRFLDYDSSFSSFKGVVIDEVEDLIKEINTIFKLKVEEIDKNMTKISFINNEAGNVLNSVTKFQTNIQDEILDLNDKISDLKVKFDILVPEQHSINDHIHYMKTYEDQLIGLIRSLKEKGVGNDSIQRALINKGHPRYYVSMLVKDFDELFN